MASRVGMVMLTLVSPSSNTNDVSSTIPRIKLNISPGLCCSDSPQTPAQSAHPAGQGSPEALVITSLRISPPTDSHHDMTSSGRRVDPVHPSVRQHKPSLNITSPWNNTDRSRHPPNRQDIRRRGPIRPVPLSAPHCCFLLSGIWHYVASTTTIGIPGLECQVIPFSHQSRWRLGCGLYGNDYLRRRADWFSAVRSYSRDRWASMVVVSVCALTS